MKKLKPEDLPTITLQERAMLRQFFLNGEHARERRKKALIGALMCAVALFAVHLADPVMRDVESASNWTATFQIFIKVVILLQAIVWLFLNFRWARNADAAQAKVAADLRERGMDVSGITYKDALIYFARYGQ